MLASAKFGRTKSLYGCPLTVARPQGPEGKSKNAILRNTRPMATRGLAEAAGSQNDLQQTAIASHDILQIRVFVEPSGTVLTKYYPTLP